VTAIARNYRFVVALGVLSCSAPDQSANRPSSVSPPSTASAPDTAQGPAKPACPADGLWHECSILERLDRAGLAPRKDSTQVNEAQLTQHGILVRLGSAELELFIYSDSAARAADEVKLPKAEFVDAGQPYTMRHERTLIRSANMLAILKSLRDIQRERVANAITAGPPQPNR
jgi:hypothetical protein